jgi:hypothetical protein
MNKQNYSHRIKLTLFTSFIALSTFSIGAEANDLPFGVSPKEIAVSGTLDYPEPMTYGLSRSGDLLNSYEYKEGNRTGVQISSVSYSLDFWNVGKMGGTSGYLFWKKDFAGARLSLQYNVSANGQIITDRVDNSKIGLPDGWKMEPAENEPDIHAVSCGLQFSGGPRGTFTGTCNKGAKIEGRIAGNGSYVIFENIAQPSDEASVEPALYALANKELMLSGQFSDWKFDMSTLEDSGARFSSMTGEVETKHENDTEWRYSKLDTVLYVLDHVKTGEESQAIIGFADLSTYLLNEESEIVITTPPKKNSKIGLVLGNIKVNIKKMITEGTMEVEMSQAIAGARGTRFILTETGVESKIEVTEGAVAFRSKVSGQEVLVSAGESVVATTEGLREKTTFDAVSADAELVKETTEVPSMISPNLAPTTQENSNTQGAEDSGNGTITILALICSALVIGIGIYIRRRMRSATQ